MSCRKRKAICDGPILTSSGGEKQRVRVSFTDLLTRQMGMARLLYVTQPRERHR